MSNPHDTAKDRTSILGPTIHFKGELSADEDLVINGTVEGSITRMQRLTIGREGTVHANVDAQLVVVEGTMQGDVHAAKSVAVAQTARMVGNITAPTVTILEGARFNGSVDMSESGVARESGTAGATGMRRSSGAA